MRFFGPLRELSHEMAARLTQIDYDREMAFLLLDGEELLGVGPARRRSRLRAGGVRADRRLRSPGPRLWRRCCCDHVLHYAKARGVKRVIGHVLRENHKMLELAKRLGFMRESGRSGEPDIRVVKSARQSL